MRHGRFITTALAAVAAMAIGPAWAAAAPSSFLDDSATEFGTGTPATDAWAIEPASATAPGSVRLRPTGATSESDTFDGASLDATKWKATSWGAAGTGTASVAAGSLTVDGQRVNDLNDPNPAPTMVPTAGAPLILEFRATFGAEIFQNVGFGVTFANGPWAMFGTGDDSSYRPLGLYARTLDTGGFSTNTAISAAIVNPTEPHVYRIEWSTSDVKFYVDGLPVVTNPVTPPVISSPMHPVVSDVTPGGPPAKTVKVDWLGMGSFASSGKFTSQVHDAGDNRAVWGALTQTAVAPAGTAVTIKTRSGKTATPDTSWSDYQPLGAGGAIQSPIGRYIQYQATLTTTDIHVTPSLDSVQIGYAIDTTPPSVAAGAVQVSGTTASVPFSSPDADIAGFECSLDSGAFTTCTSPKELTGLAAGSHTLAVRGVDKAGNVGDADSKTFSIASPQSGGTPSGGSSSADKTAPNVSVVAKSLRASKRGTVSFRVGCPAGETRCKVTLQLKRGGSVAASKTVTVLGGKTVTVTLQLAKATRKQLHSHGSLKLTAVTTARDAAGNKKTAKQSMTLRAPRA